MFLIEALSFLGSSCILDFQHFEGGVYRLILNQNAFIPIVGSRYMLIDDEILFLLHQFFLVVVRWTIQRSAMK